MVNSIIVKHSYFVFVEYSVLLLKLSDVWFTLLFDLRFALVALWSEYCFLFFVTLVSLLLALLVLLSEINLNFEFV